jgi:hypothetical protein
MPSTPLPRWAHTDTLLHSQDLKQQKFVIEAEPSELVCIPNLALSTSFSNIWPPDDGPMSKEKRADDRGNRSPM